MEESGIKILYEGGTGELVEKKSRFIANVRKIENEQEAMDFIAEMKKRYWDLFFDYYEYSIRNWHLH